jgi:hypothetical protein
MVGRCAHDARSAARAADVAVSHTSCRAGPWLADAGSADSMNVLAASHLQAAGLARLDSDGARMKLTPAAMGVS